MTDDELDIDDPLTIYLYGYDKGQQHERNLIVTVTQGIAGKPFVPIADQIAAAELRGVALGIEAAAQWAKDDAKTCDCDAHSESECACGAWCEWKTVPMHHVVQAIRDLDPAAILKARARAKATGTIGDSDGDDGA